MYVYKLKKRLCAYIYFFNVLLFYTSINNDRWQFTNLLFLGCQILVLLNHLWWWGDLNEDSILKIFFKTIVCIFWLYQNLIFFKKKKYCFFVFFLIAYFYTQFILYWQLFLWKWIYFIKIISSKFDL